MVASVRSVTVDDPDPVTRSERAPRGKRDVHRRATTRLGRCGRRRSPSHSMSNSLPRLPSGAERLETDEVVRTSVPGRDLERWRPRTLNALMRGPEEALGGSRDHGIPPRRPRQRPREDAQTGGPTSILRWEGDAHVGNLSQAERREASRSRQNDYADPRAGKMTVGELPASGSLRPRLSGSQHPAQRRGDSFGPRLTAGTTLSS